MQEVAVSEEKNDGLGEFPPQPKVGRVEGPPAPSAERFQEALSYVIEKDRVVTEDLPKRFLEVLSAVLKHSNYRLVLDNFSRVTARCANCATACQIYQATGAPEDVPCYRSHLLLDIYQRHFTLKGAFSGHLLGKEPLTVEKILEMAESFYRCTACRRCTLECPLGVDHGLITHLGRYLLSEVGLVPRALVVSTRAQLEGETRNTSAIPLPAILDSLEFLSEEIKEDKEIDVEYPIDKEGRDFIFFAPVSDYLMEADTLMGIALMLRVSGQQDNWTIGSKFNDGINYGLFYSDWILERCLLEIKSETERLGAKQILIGECGHASRSVKAFMGAYGGGKDAPQMTNIMELTYRLWKEGRFKLKPDVIKDRVTYHDPCNVARSGWIVKQPREIIRSFCGDFVEMEPHGEKNLCCGGGGGTVSVDELRPYRTGVMGKKKAEQLAATGAKYVIAPCANCKKQLRELVEDHKLEMEVVGLHDLLYKAIVID